MTTVTKDRNKMADDVITRVTLTLMLYFYSIHLCGKKGPFYTILYGHKGPFFELGAIVTPILLMLVFKSMLLSKTVCLSQKVFSLSPILKAVLQFCKNG